MLRCTTPCSCAAFVGLCRQQYYSRWLCRWCCPVWIMAKPRLPVPGWLDRLQSVISAAARLVCSARKYEHITPLIRDLHWLPVHKRIEFKRAVLVFRCLHGTAPGERAVSCGGHWCKKTAALCVNVCSRNAVIVSFDDWWPSLLRRCSTHLEQFAIQHHCVMDTQHLQALAEDTSFRCFAVSLT